MGLDLTLLPFDCELPTLAFAHSALECERRGVLFDAIMRLAGEPVPPHFKSYLSRDEKYEEPHYGDTQKTPYGETLTAVRVGDLTAFSHHVGVMDNRKNRAVWAYLRELPPETRVALYWH